MIAQNEINVQGELANKTDNYTALYKHCTWMILVQIKWWYLYDYSIPDSRGKTHLTSLFNCWTKNIVALFLYYAHHDMNFHSCKKQIFEFFDCTKIRSDSKWTKRSRNEVMKQPRSSNSDSRQISSYHVHNQAGFDNPFINWRGFIYLGNWKISCTF